jgi:hypothetical protein
MLLSLVAAVDLVLIAIFGPLSQPDSDGYVGYADAILRDTSWLHDAGVAASAVPPMLLRTVGYPLVIAAAKWLAGEDWGWLVIGLQCIAWLPAAAAIHAVTRRLTPATHWPATVMLLLSSFSLMALYRLTIMTDSLNASIYVFVMMSLLRRFLDGTTERPAVLAGYGGLITLSILIRPSTLAFGPLLLPLVWLVAPRGARRPVALLAFLVPMIAGPAAHIAWNHHRTGHAALSQMMQVDLLFPIFNMAGRGYDVRLADIPSIAPIAAEIEPTLDFPGVLV